VILKVDACYVKAGIFNRKSSTDVRGSLALGKVFFICKNYYVTKTQSSTGRFCRAMILLKQIVQTYRAVLPEKMILVS